MNLPKLFNKGFPILLKGGLDADLGKFAKQAAAGELERTTDTDRVFIATTTADDTADASTVELVTLRPPVTITGDTELTVANHHGKVLYVDKATDVNLTYNSLEEIFNCLIVQVGVGQAILVGTGNVHHPDDHDRTSAQDAMMTFLCKDATNAYIGGNTAAA